MQNYAYEIRNEREIGHTRFLNLLLVEMLCRYFHFSLQFFFGINKLVVDL